MLRKNNPNVIRAYNPDVNGHVYNNNPNVVGTTYGTTTANNNYVYDEDRRNLNVNNTNYVPPQTRMTDADNNV